MRDAAGKSSRTRSGLSLTWDDTSPDDWAPRGARGEAETGTGEGMGRGESSEGMEEEEGSGKREATGESSARRIGAVKEVAISET